MKRKKPVYLLKYVLLSNGEEYPHEIQIEATTPELAKSKLVSDVTLVGQCEVRICDVTPFYSSR